MKVLLQNKARGVLLALLAAVYAAFLILDAGYPYHAASNLLKYGGMLLCWLVTAVSCRESYSRRDGRLLLLALLLTLIADAQLLFGSTYTSGVFCFCCAHVAHIRRYSRRWFAAVLAATMNMMLFCLIGWQSGRNWPFLYFAAVLYAALLCCHMVCAWLQAPRVLPACNTRLVRTGVLLLFCCDCCVLLRNMPQYAGRLYPAAACLIWLFYLPSQVFFAVSGICFENKISQNRIL